METFERNWYVLHTYSGYENKVKANIESRAQSMGWAIIFFVSLYQKKQKRSQNGKEKKSFIKLSLVMC